MKKGVQVSILEQESRKAAHQIKKNCDIFLKRASIEIVSGSDENDRLLSEEAAAVVAFLTQMAVELAMAAYIVHSHGLRKIVQKGENFSDSEIIQMWKKNELRTIRFEEMKIIMKEQHNWVFEPLEGIVDDFQNIRNKIAHLAFHFAEGDRFDIKYDATFLIIHIASSLRIDDTTFPESLYNIISKTTIKKLMAYEPYQAGVRKLAAEWSKLVLECPACKIRAFAEEEMRCFACGWEGEVAIGLLPCEKCQAESVAFDRLNLPFNQSITAKCLNCGEMCLAFYCSSCDENRITFNAKLICAECGSPAAFPKNYS